MSTSQWLACWLLPNHSCIGTTGCKSLVSPCTKKSSSNQSGSTPQKASGRLFCFFNWFTWLPSDACLACRRTPTGLTECVLMTWQSQHGINALMSPLMLWGQPVHAEATMSMLLVWEEVIQRQSFGHLFLTWLEISFSACKMLQR